MYKAELVNVCLNANLDIHPTGQTVRDVCRDHELLFYKPSGKFYRY